MNIGIEIGINDSQNPLYGHLIITDSLLCPWKESPIFSLTSTRLMKTLSIALSVCVFI